MNGVPSPILVDMRNIDELESQLLAEIQNAGLIGLDTETQDTNAHAGIKAFRSENANGDKKGKKNAFDWRATVVTGLSIYCEGSPHAYYFNLAHADVENRLPWIRVKRLLDAKPNNVSFLCHNAPFELTVLKNNLNYQLKDTICTLQMAVSAYGPDEYDPKRFVEANFGDITQLFDQAALLFDKNLPPEEIDPNVDLDTEEKTSNYRNFNPKQQELLNKVLGKSSKASYSWNGLQKMLSWGYDLKGAVKSHFGYQMQTYQETLGTARHMGELTGEQVAAYGCDDAYWVVPLFYKLCEYMGRHSPKVMGTFFSQENPMAQVYSDIRQQGLKVNSEAIDSRRTLERKVFAQKIRELKAEIRNLLPFRDELDEKLVKYEKWYVKSGQEYRKKLAQWANTPDSDDDFKQACQVSSPVSNAWAGKKCTGISIMHYFQVRILMYDLCQVPAIIYKKKVSSDAECRGEVLEKITQLKDTNEEFYKSAERLVKLLGETANVETRMKLYLTPYTQLTDPETQRMYAEVSSMLATRRMAASNPNPMQLAKRGESTYVRGFYTADSEEELLVSLDWSQVELVIIGELSGDPEFKKAYGQLPYSDLHLGAAADILSIMIPEVTEGLLNNMHKMLPEQIPHALLLKPNGEVMTPASAKKFWRTTVGKGANFNYWYSGALATIGELLGWTSDQMWKATEKYRERFIHAEKWRNDVILTGRETGKVELRDGHTRVRYEATYEFQNLAKRMFANYNSSGITAFGNEIVRAVSARAGNQLVNAAVQGTSATLAKRSILLINKKIKEMGLQARFKMPIHDELLFSVRKDQVIEFIKMAKEVMSNHHEIISDLKLYATASVGYTFEPFDKIKAPFGQVELDECPECFGFGDGVVLDDNQTREVIDYLIKREIRWAA